jgi:hypothetical protein
VPKVRTGYILIAKPYTRKPPTLLPPPSSLLTLKPQPYTPNRSNRVHADKDLEGMGFTVGGKLVEKYVRDR